LTDIIKNTTRIIIATSTLIDLISIIEPDVIKSQGVIPSAISDHDVAYCIRKKPRNKNLQRKVVHVNSLKKIPN